MKHTIAFGLLLCLPALSAFAGSGASVSSSEQFRLRGAVVPAGGVPSWPVWSGDEIATERAAATVFFGDGRSVTIKPNSIVRFETTNNESNLRVIKGGVSGGAVSQLSTSTSGVKRNVNTPGTRVWSRPPPNSPMP